MTLPDRKPPVLSDVGLCHSHDRSHLKHDLRIYASEYIRKMRGGSESHLVSAEGVLYVVKFAENPQFKRVLANEWLAASIAMKLGLPVPEIAIVEISESFLAKAPALCLQSSNGSPYKAGRHFGSRFIGGAASGRTLDSISDAVFEKIDNLSVFAGALAFDKWTCNADGRQCVFVQGADEELYTVYMIDQGCCFGSPTWMLSDTPRRGTYARPVAYASISGRDDFEPWISLIEAFSLDDLYDAAYSIPPDWYDDDWQDLRLLVEQLYVRRKEVWNLILSFKTSAPVFFPRWNRQTL